MSRANPRNAQISSAVTSIHFASAASPNTCHAYRFVSSTIVVISVVVKNSWNTPRMVGGRMPAGPTGWTKGGTSTFSRSVPQFLVGSLRGVGGLWWRMKAVRLLVFTLTACTHFHYIVLFILRMQWHIPGRGGGVGAVSLTLQPRQKVQLLDFCSSSSTGLHIYYL